MTKSPWHIPFGDATATPYYGAFFGRLGGVSVGHNASLNLGTGTGDDAETIEENGRRVLATLGVERLALPRQVHEADVIVLDEPSAEGVSRLGDADAIMTTVPGQGVGVLTADCVPVLLADIQGRAVAAVHAGWRGLAAGVIGACVARMGELGISANDLVAAVGPAIGPEAYQVDDALADRFAHEIPGGAGQVIRVPGRQPVIDLPSIAASQLKAAGIDPARVTVHRRSTAAEPDAFFSHRGQDGKAGRQLAAVALGRP
ncbi:peptidoglycan editing factor PgeF [bacterium]|nr:peptidoglycan editing factor PgeF [bacterium]